MGSAGYCQVPIYLLEQEEVIAGICAEIGISSLKKIDTNELYILDDWQEYHYEETVFSTKAISQVLRE